MIDVFNDNKRNDLSPTFCKTTKNRENVVYAEEIRQYFYCKRIPYWRRIADINGVKTKLMKRGEEYHKQKISYNYVRKGDLENIRDRFYFHKEKNFGGKIDLLRVREDELIPVEYKRFFHSKKPSKGHILQAIVGGLAAEYEIDKPIYELEIRYFRGIKATVVLTDEMRFFTLKMIEDLRKMLDHKVLPQPTNSLNKCHNCEYYKICHRT